MYGVPGTISSRVPMTRPGRPSSGKSRSRSTASVIDITMRAAADGLSRAMYWASASKFARAAWSHLTRTTGPFFHGPFHFLVAGEVSTVGFGYTFLNFVDLPVVQRDIFSNRFCCHKRTAAAHRARQAVQLLLEFRIKP